MNDDELLPCPFCGSNDISMFDDRVNNDIVEYYCENCMACTPAEIWNKRSVEVAKQVLEDTGSIVFTPKYKIGQEIWVVWGGEKAGKLYFRPEKMYISQYELSKYFVGSSPETYFTKRFDESFLYPDQASCQVACDEINTIGE